MRKLIVMRGPQGAGKSRFVSQIGLQNYVLSPDRIRGLFAAPVLTPNGKLGISQDHEKKVWSLVGQILRLRMSRGELLVVDATHRARRDFHQYMQLARRYRYQVACVDFSTMPLSQVLHQNQQREERKRVPRKVVEKTYKACLNGKIPNGVKHFVWEANEQLVARVKQWLEVPTYDLSKYDKIHHIGDLQGCKETLQNYLTDGLQDNEFYVFVGDICDRGPENGSLLQFMISIFHYPNVVILWGNHEDYLQAWCVDEKVTNNEFNTKTLPQLQAENITTEQVDQLLATIREVFFYSWRGYRVLVCHGGISTIPANPERISTQQYSHGTGFYPSLVDQQFSQQAPSGWYQVHGHRNAQYHPIVASDRSFNLEGQVEHGGDLRILCLEKDGFIPHSLRNNRFIPLHQRIESGFPSHDPYPTWVTPEMDVSARISSEQLAALQEHPLVYSKNSDSAPHVFAFNFTRDAFFKAAWDDINVKARGLFINLQRSEIVARSYDKFFNLYERPETKLSYLEANLTFPLTVYVKENGYLGILGFDSQTDELFFASKSTPDSPFARWFEEIVKNTISPGHLEKLRRYLRDTSSAMVFEVVDPNRDPHIISYSSPFVQLLDVIHRSSEFRRLDYHSLQKVGKQIGFEVKVRAMELKDWASFKGWLKQAEQPNYQFRGRHIEGFVLEDASGVLFKIKLSFYNFWKRMRSLKDRVLSLRRKPNAPLQRDISHPTVKRFYEWCKQQPDQVLEQDICTLREAFLSGGPTFIEEDDNTEIDSPQLIGFRRALTGVSSTTKPLKPATADQLLQRALQSDELLQVLREHQVCITLLMAATPGEDRDHAAEVLGVDIDKEGDPV